MSGKEEQKGQVVPVCKIKVHNVNNPAVMISNERELRSKLRALKIEGVVLTIHDEDKTIEVERRIGVPHPKGVDVYDAVIPFSKQHGAKSGKEPYVELIFPGYEHRKEGRPNSASGIPEVGLEKLLDANKTLGNRLSEAVTKKIELEDQVATLQSELAGKEDYDALRSENGELRSDLARLEGAPKRKIRALTRHATIQDVFTALGDNEKAYSEALSRVREEVIADPFYDFLTEIKELELSDETPEEVRESMKILEERDKYYEDYGRKAIERLPETERDSVTSRWSSAERIIRESKVPMLVRVARASGSYAVIIPVSPSFKDPLSQKLIETLKRSGSLFELEQRGVTCRYETDKPFAFLRIEGPIKTKEGGEDSRDVKEYQVIRERLEDSFRKVDPSLEVKIFYTPWLGEREIPVRDIENSFGKFYTQQIRQLDGGIYRTTSQFARAKGINPHNVFTRFKNPENRRYAKPESVQRIADLLQVPLEEVQKYFKANVSDRE